MAEDVARGSPTGASQPGDDGAEVAEVAEERVEVVTYAGRPCIWRPLRPRAAG
jgi:hypothetical protein